jgi:hypothetical protein
MPTRKIGDLPKPSDGWFAKPGKPCLHPEHDPPQHICLPPGIYEHKCPGCGRKVVFRVQGAYCGIQLDWSRVEDRIRDWFAGQADRPG